MRCGAVSCFNEVVVSPVAESRAVFPDARPLALADAVLCWLACGGRRPAEKRSSKSCWPGL